MALVSAGQAPAALERAVEKLQRIVLPDGEDAFLVDLTEPELVGRLREAAGEGSVVRITHTGLARGETTVRDIEPWSVFSTMGNWYVAA